MSEPTREPLSDLERALAGLAPQPTLHRDEVLFQAGVRHARRRPKPVVPILTLVLGLALGSTMALWLRPTTAPDLPPMAAPQPARSFDAAPVGREGSTYWNLHQQLVQGAELPRENWGDEPVTGGVSLAEQRSKWLGDIEAP
jgi:hypothetical protein